MQTLGEALAALYPRPRIEKTIEYLVELRPSVELEADLHRARNRLTAELLRHPSASPENAASSPLAVRRAAEDADRRLQLVKDGRRRDLLALAYGCWCLGLGGRGPRQAWRDGCGWLTVDGVPVDELHDYCACPVGLEMRAERDRLVAVALAQAAAERRFRVWARVPSELQDVSLDTYPDHTAEQRAAVTTLRMWAVLSTWLMLWGRAGVGKTGLAISAARETSVSWQFVTAADLLTEIRATYDRDRESRDGEREASVLGRYYSAPLLILDDLGAQPSGDWADSVLYQLVTHREAEHRRTIVTANKSPHELERKLGDQGERVMSRILGAARPYILEVVGPDLRVERLRR